MSRRNGERSKADIARKKRLERRKRTKELRASLTANANEQKTQPAKKK